MSGQATLRLCVCRAAALQLRLAKLLSDKLAKDESTSTLSPRPSSTYFNRSKADERSSLPHMHSVPEGAQGRSPGKLGSFDGFDHFMQAGSPHAFSTSFKPQHSRDDVAAAEAHKEGRTSGHTYVPLHSSGFNGDSDKLGPRASKSKGLTPPAGGLHHERSSKSQRYATPAELVRAVRHSTALCNLRCRRELIGAQHWRCDWSPRAAAMPLLLLVLVCCHFQVMTQGSMSAHSYGRAL